MLLPSAPQAVVFDFGNVLVYWDLFAALTPRWTREEVEQMIRETDFATFNHLNDAGRSWDESLVWLADHHPRHVEMVRDYVENVRASVTGPVAGMDEVVRELKQAGVTCIGLTNWSAETYHVAGELNPVIEELDDIVVSGIEKVAKPDSRIFDITTARLGLAPEQIAFIDDAPANIAAAQAHGWHAIQFENAAQTRCELAGLGLPIRIEQGDA